jgi:hypothetical protein
VFPAPEIFGVGEEADFGEVVGERFISRGDNFDFKLGTSIRLGLPISALGLLALLGLETDGSFLSGSFNSIEIEVAFVI